MDGPRPNRNQTAPPRGALRWTLIGALSLVWGLASELPGASAWEPQPELRNGHRIRVRLPIDELVSREVKQSLKRIADTSDRSIRAEDRTVVVLEFDTSRGQTGRGSELEACQSLARLMTEAEVNHLELVAYVPPLVSLPDSLQGDDSLKPGLYGHAVLVAMAANRLALSPGMSIGKAGIDEDRLDPLDEAVYRAMGDRRMRLQLPIVMSMLDRKRGLYRVLKSDQSVEYVDQRRLTELESSGTPIEDTATITQPGKLTELSVDQFQEYRLDALHPNSLDDLAGLLKVRAETLEVEQGAARQWQAIHLPLPYLIDDKAQRWIGRQLGREVGEGANLILITIDESIGDVTAALEIASILAEFRDDDVRTVAFVRGKARGPAALIALACDQLIMTPDAVLGGRDELQDPLTDAQLAEAKTVLQELGSDLGRDWSLSFGMLDPTQVITAYRDPRGQIRLLGNEESESLETLDELTPLRPVELANGFSTTTADSLGLVRLIAEDMGQLQTFFQLDEMPPTLTLTQADRWIEKFARFLAHPLITVALIWAAFFFLSAEMSAPGLGIPGFLGSVCLVLFFWSMWLDGNAELFEILMFVVGIIFLLVELFVIPGFGIFGVGGVALILASLVLSTQKFLIPTTAAEIEQLPYALLPVAGAGLGVVAAGYFFGSIVENSPVFRRMLLKKRERDETGLEADRDPEATADFSYLMNSSGTAITRLVPAGKARIQGRIYDVISTGRMIDKDSEIEVVEAVANRIVVRQKSVENESLPAANS